MRSGAVMGWSNSTRYYVSMAWCGTAVAPLITHWSCCSLAVDHRYKTVATGLGRKRSNKKRHPTSRPHRWALGCLFFEDLWILPCYDGTATALKPCLSVFFSQRCTCCTPRTYNFVLAMCHLHVLIDALLLGSRECKWEQIALLIFFFILSFFLAPPDICFV